MTTYAVPGCTVPPIGACMTCRQVRLIAEAVTDRAGYCADCASEEEA